MTGLTTNAPIGVFDSGVGGLSVLREIRNTLPNEDLLYVADSGFAPYGDRTTEFISKRAHTIGEFFMRVPVKAIVVACNTATAVAIQTLRAQFNIPIIAIEPAIKPAAEITKTGVIGILATSQTLASERFAQLAQTYAKDIEVILQACPGLMEQVEKAELDGLVTGALIRRFVCPLLDRGVDTIVLGCTHYPFLNAAIKAVVGPAITLVDPAFAVARQLKHRLSTHGLLSATNSNGTEKFWTSGIAAQVQTVVSQLWHQSASVDALPTT